MFSFTLEFTCQALVKDHTGQVPQHERWLYSMRPKTDRDVNIGFHHRVSPAEGFPEGVTALYPLATVLDACVAQHHLSAESNGVSLDPMPSVWIRLGRMAGLQFQRPSPHHCGELVR